MASLLAIGGGSGRGIAPSRRRRQLFAGSYILQLFAGTFFLRIWFALRVLIFAILCGNGTGSTFLMFDST